MPLPPAAPADAPCGDCQRRPPAFDRCIAPLLYAGAVPYLVTELKFRKRLSHGRLLGALLGRGLRAVRGGVGGPDLILPVPLHPARLRERGFNQALEIARGPGRLLGLPLAAKACVRTRATAPQSALAGQARRRNLRGAFTVTGPLPEWVAVVDDVVTTGATVEAVAQALKEAGARRVEVWAVARTALGGTTV
jgi:ComF family protein